MQLVNMQKEMQKQMNAIVSTPVNKEGKRLEASLGRNVEKVIKANMDALWARFQEENAKHEKLERDRTQQIMNLLMNCINKDFPAIFEKTLKKEIATVGPLVARVITPILEKSIASATTESFQVRKISKFVDISGSVWVSHWNEIFIYLDKSILINGAMIRNMKSIFIVHEV